jgi:hypothetical protein
MENKGKPTIEHIRRITGWDRRKAEHMQKNMCLIVMPYERAKTLVHEVNKRQRSMRKYR